MDIYVSVKFDASEKWTSKNEVVYTISTDESIHKAKKKFDENGRLISDESTSKGAPISNERGEIYSYDVEGELSKIKKYNTYNLKGRPKEEHVYTIYLVKVLERDAKGNILKLENLTEQGEVAETVTYTYRYKE